MTTLVREAAEGGAALLARLIRRSFRDVAERFGLTLQNCPANPSNCTEDWVSAAMQKGVVYWVLESDGEPVGCAALERADGDACYLQRLAVLPQHRRQGYGAALVGHVLAQAKGMGLRRVDIGIIAQDEGLRRWYEGLGFRAGERRRFDHLPFEVLLVSAPV